MRFPRLFHFNVPHTGLRVEVKLSRSGWWPKVGARVRAMHHPPALQGLRKNVPWSQAQSRPPPPLQPDRRLRHALVPAEGQPDTASSSSPRSTRPLAGACLPRSPGAISEICWGWGGDSGRQHLSSISFSSGLCCLSPRPLEGKSAPPSRKKPPIPPKEPGMPPSLDLETSRFTAYW